MPTTMMKITHTLEVFDVRHAPCISHPKVQSKRAKPGAPHKLSLQNGFYILVDMTTVVPDKVTGEEVTYTFGWLREDLDFWSHLDAGDERRVVLNEVRAAVA